MGHQGTQPTLSLREPKVRGNLGMGHNYSIDDFFFSSVFIFIVSSEFFFFFVLVFVVSGCGLLRRFTPRNDSIHKLVIARVACNSWQSRYGNNHTQSTSVIARTEGSWQSRYMA